MSGLRIGWLSSKRAAEPGASAALGDDWRPVSLSEKELERYARHIVLPLVGGVGQRKLKAASVAVTGAGDPDGRADPQPAVPVQPHQRPEL